jgi:regulator of replication initiation timing
MLKDKNKKIFRKRRFFILLLLLVLLSSAGYFVFFYFTPISFFDEEKNNFSEEVQIPYQSANDLQELKKHLQKTEESNFELKNEIRDLREKLNNNTEEISKITAYKNEIIKIALNIQNQIRDFKSYNTDLQIMKSLPLGQAIEQEVAFLEQHSQNLITKETIVNDFDEELSLFLEKNNLLKNNEGRFLRFLSYFVVLEDKKNLEIEFSEKLKESIKNGDYEKAYLLLFKNNSYINSFPKTNENLLLLFNLNRSLRKIIILTTKGDATNV